MGQNRDIGVVIAALAALGVEAHADRRAFTNAYESLTLPKDGVQVDVSTTQAYGFGNDTTRFFQLQLDAALGITDRWDVAAFQIYDEQTDDDPMTADIAFQYEESRFRTRYRFSERGELPVDLLGMLDLSKSFRSDGWGIAPRLVVARDVDDLTFVANASAEIGLGSGKTTFSAGWAAGVTYEIASKLKVGAEAFGAKQIKGGSANTAWAGPCVSWAPTTKAWIASCGDIGLTAASIDYRQQVIIGLLL
jgi:hypothetical protein